MQIRFTAYNILSAVFLVSFCSSRGYIKSWVYPLNQQRTHQVPSHSPSKITIFRIPPSAIQSIFQMHFTKAFVAATATLLTSVYAQMTAPQIVSNINIITGQSQALQGPANSINLLSGPLFLIGQGPFPVSISHFQHHPRNFQLTQQQIVVGFSEIVTTVTNDIQAMTVSNESSKLE
jgi:hypothetical protein